MDNSIVRIKPIIKVWTIQAGMRIRHIAENVTGADIGIAVLSKLGEYLFVEALKSSRSNSNFGAILIGKEVVK